MATTNNIKYAKKMMLYRTNGITKKNKLFKFKKKNEPWYYEQQSIGFNYRMNDISAALGISQLQRIVNFIKKRNYIAKIYRKRLKSPFIKFQSIKSDNLSSYHLFIIKLEIKRLKFTYKKIFNYLRKKNIYVNLHYLPLHLSPFFRNLGFKLNTFPSSEEFSKSAISIPIFYDLKKKQIENVCKEIKRLLK